MATSTDKALVGCVGCLSIPFLLLGLLFILFLIFGPNHQELEQQQQADAKQQQAEDAANRKANPRWYHYIDKYGDPPTEAVLSLYLMNQGFHDISFDRDTTVKYYADGWLIGSRFSHDGGPLEFLWFVVDHNTVIETFPAETFQLDWGTPSE